MAKIETYFDCDLKKAVQVQPLNGNVFSLDNNGNRIGVRIFDNGVKTTVTGTVTGRAILADNSTVNLNGGLTTVNGQSVAYVDVPQGALLIPGTIKITIQLTASGVITTLAAILSTVYQTKTDNVITPSAQVIADWNAEISSAIQTQNATIASAIATQDAQISDLKSALHDKITNLVLLDYTANVRAEPLREVTSDGVEFIRNGNSIRVNGTSTTSHSINFFANAASLPPGMTAGSTYKFIVSGNYSVCDVSVFYNDGTSWALLKNSIKATTEIAMPSNAVGLLARLDMSANKTANNEYIYIAITDTDQYTNFELADLIDIISPEHGIAFGNRGILENADANDYLDNGCWRVPDNANVQNLPFEGMQGTLVSFRGQSAFVQLYFSYYNPGNVAMRRGFTNNPAGASDWIPLILNGMNVPTGTNLNSWIQDGHYHLNDEYTYMNSPVSSGYLENVRVASSVILQRVTAGNLSNVYIRRGINNNWSAWVDISGDTINKHWKIAMCGDSITWGRNGSGSGQVSDTIPIIVSRSRNINAVNYGYGSMGWVSTQHRTENDTALDVVQDYIDYTGVNAISYMFGTNDCGDVSVTIGSYLTTTDDGSLMGRIYTCMKYVADNHPGITQILIGIPNIDYGTFPQYCWNDAVFGDGKTRKDFNDEMRKFAEYYQIPFIDLSKGGITSFNISTMIGDRVHPTQAGYYALGGYISGQLESILGD